MSTVLSELEVQAYIETRLWQLWAKGNTYGNLEEHAYDVLEEIRDFNDKGLAVFRQSSNAKLRSLGVSIPLQDDIYKGLFSEWLKGFSDSNARGEQQQQHSGWKGALSYFTGTPFEIALNEGVMLQSVVARVLKNTYDDVNQRRSCYRRKRRNTWAWV
jgi:hypothetical protein